MRLIRVANRVLIGKFTGIQDRVVTWGGYFGDTVLHGSLTLPHVSFQGWLHYDSLGR